MPNNLIRNLLGALAIMALSGCDDPRHLEEYRVLRLSDGTCELQIKRSWGWDESSDITSSDCGVAIKYASQHMHSTVIWP